MNQSTDVPNRATIIPPKPAGQYDLGIRLTSERWTPVVIFLLTTISFVIANASYSGPVILPDEIGYLAYGEFLAGYSVDAASSFHFGYSLFLAPLFWALSSTEAIWNGVTVVNGAFFGGALAMCFRLSREMFPTRPALVAALTTGLCGLYPAWISISGYAFSQGCFAFFFVLTAYLLMKSQSSKACAIGAAASAAFLFWIHALGIVCCVTTVLMIGLMSRNLRLTGGAIVVTLILVGAYELWLSPAVKAAMTPAGFSPLEHYPPMSGAMDIILSPSGLLEFSTRALGQLTYLFIATLGLAVTPLWIAFSAAIALLRGRIEKDPLKIVSLFVVGSIAGMTIFSAAMFTVVESAVRQDHWMYGRYNDGALLPILLIGLSIAPSRLSSVVALLIPAAFAMLVSRLAPDAPPLSVINSAAFWPVAAFPDAAFSTQVLIGGLAAGAVTAVASANLAVVALLVAFLICLPRQFEWHDMASRVQHVPQTVKLIRDRLSPGSCVAFDPASGYSRMHFLVFYLFDYRYSRVAPTAWKAKCDGPFLALDKGPPDADWVAVGGGGLMVFGKGTTPPDHYSRIALADARNCTDGWCYIADAEMLSHSSQNGHLVDGSLAASGPAGYLFFGPYLKMKQGRYQLSLSGTGHSDLAQLDVATDGGKNIVAKFPITTLNPMGQEFSFDLPFDAKDLEVRMNVPAGAEMAVTGYVLRQQDEKEISALLPN
ncbi:hypothetical protein [Mesorhizobium sp. B2-4-11]|uniref:hypothetical protein n=1 Tax=Mesorhizobium sp. B2-4-11 TaxID=2589938 RepID=UPI001127006B|nr:hypothetical protein [Mesorhizobium sp. B2-4-11]TPL06701.1 hypothetical protein FJ944_23010 [Mesorhizobium sp. B2-4-11]